MSLRTLLSVVRQSTISRCASTKMHPMVAVCQMKSVNDKEENYKVISELVAKAAGRSASIAFFPEACDYMGDSIKDIINKAEPLDGKTVTRYKELARQHKIWLSFGGIHEAAANDSNKIFNTHILIDDKGETQGTYRKIHLFDMESQNTGVRLMESDYVVKGSEILPPVSTPVGQLGLSICYDLRFPELSLALRNKGAQILTYPSAFTYQTGAAHWETLLKARAIETQCYVIAAAQIGQHNKKRVSWGHSVVIDPWGTVVSQCSNNVGITFAEIDLDYVERIRKEMPCENHRRTDLYPSIGL